MVGQHSESLVFYASFILDKVKDNKFSCLFILKVQLLLNYHFLAFCTLFWYSDILYLAQ